MKFVNCNAVTNRSLERGVNVIMWVYLLTVISLYGPAVLVSAANYNDWCLSEFLINYQGGFVRRGLLGEVLYQMATLSGLDIRLIVFPVCICTFAVVVFFLLRYFRQYKLYWWILPTMYALGSARNCIIRKDFIVLSAFIGILYIYRNTKLHPSFRLCLITLMCVLLNLIYEPAFFMFMPFLGLLIWHDKTFLAPRWQKITAICVVLCLMGILVLTTGSPAKADAIQASWHALHPEIIPSTPCASVWAIGWDLSYSLRFNNSILCYAQDSIQGVNSILFRILALIIMPYILIRYVYIMYKGDKPQFPCAYDVWGTLVLCQMLSLTPMWLGLSCDYGRMCMYVVVTSLLIVFFLPQRVVTSAFPQWCTSIVGQINNRVDRLIKCNRPVMYALLLFFGVPTFYFPLKGLFLASPVGVMVDMAHKATTGEMQEKVMTKLNAIGILKQDD